MKHEVTITISMVVDGQQYDEGAVRDLIEDEFEFSAPGCCQITNVDVDVAKEQEDGWDGEEDDEVEEISFDELRHSPVD